MPPAHITLKPRAVTFVDGQNLYRSAQEIFGCSHPNYDVLKLSREVCTRRALSLGEVRFYTGVPHGRDNARWQTFWSKKLLSMTRQGVRTFSRPLRYRDETIALPGGGTYTHRRGREKGIDVRMAIDLIKMVYRREYDVAVVFSQDQDLSEVADEIKEISREQKRFIRMVSAFPHEPGNPSCRGINHTEWVSDRSSALRQMRRSSRLPLGLGPWLGCDGWRLFDPGEYCF